MVGGSRSPRIRACIPPTTMLGERFPAGRRQTPSTSGQRQNPTQTDILMDNYSVGDVIEYDLLPGFPLTVREVAPCVYSSHDKYKIVDPAGREDWVCAHDVQPSTAPR